jgi:hypothetical protein
MESIIMKLTRIITLLTGLTVFAFVLLSVLTAYSSPSAPTILQRATPAVTPFTAPTTITLAVSSERVVWPSYPVLMVAVKDLRDYPVPVGKVIFYENGKIIGMASVTTNGMAAIPYYGAAKGLHQVIAVYQGTLAASGGVYYNKSQSNPVVFELVKSDFMIR